MIGNWFERSNRSAYNHSCLSDDRAPVEAHTGSGHPQLGRLQRSRIATPKAQRANRVAHDPRFELLITFATPAHPHCVVRTRPEPSENKASNPAPINLVTNRVIQRAELPRVRRDGDDS